MVGVAAEQSQPSPGPPACSLRRRLRERVGPQVTGCCLRGESVEGVCALLLPAGGVWLPRSLGKGGLFCTEPPLRLSGSTLGGEGLCLFSSRPPTPPPQFSPPELMAAASWWPRRWTVSGAGLFFCLMLAVGVPRFSLNFRVCL